MCRERVLSMPAPTQIVSIGCSQSQGHGQVSRALLAMPLLWLRFFSVCFRFHQHDADVGILLTSQLSTRVPVRVALPVARVAVRRVQGGGPGAQSVPPRPRPSRASPSRCGSDPLARPRGISRLVPRPWGEQAVLATLIATRRVTVALLRLSTQPWVGYLSAVRLTWRKRTTGCRPDATYLCICVSVYLCICVSVYPCSAR